MASDAVEKSQHPEDVSLAAFKAFFSQHKITVRPTKPKHTEEAWAAYFKGDAPFGSVKQRADLPDGFILAAIRELNLLEEHLIVLCADVRLSAAIHDLGVIQILQFGRGPIEVA